MTAKPQISDGAGARVGVPLARAQRLAKRTETQPRRQLLPVVLIGVACVGLVVAAVSVPGPSSVGDIVDSVETVTDTAFAASEFDSLPTLPAPPPDVRALLFACVGEIEDQLKELERLSYPREGDQAASDAVSSLVQSTLNCGAAKFEIDGSPELVTAGIAEFHVRWDRKISHLYLSVVDPVEAEKMQATYAEDGLPVAFIVH